MTDPNDDPLTFEGVESLDASQLDTSAFDAPKSDLTSDYCTVRDIAGYQRNLISVLFFKLVLAIVFSFTPAHALIVLRCELIAMGLIGLISLYFIFMLTRELNGTAIAVLCSAFMFVPCLSILTILVVNQSAMAYLRRKRIRVGFFGVDPKSIE
ncbi:MAG: hypothetical protein KDA66_04960 [Planctomycetaceae bacterium]|nr:hypothetical protein [Planctomycetaceae bacterium]